MVAGDASSKARCLTQCIRISNPALWTDCCNALRLTDDTMRRRAAAKAKVLNLAKRFFNQANRITMIEPVAMVLGLLPGDFQEPVMFARADGTLQVVGSEQAWPADAPVVKFEALFDTRDCFDGVRWTFLVSADPLFQVRTFRQKLTEVIESSDQVAAGVIESVSDFLDALQELDALHIADTVPRDFSERVWPAYLQCIQDPDYWFSCDELLFFAFLAKVAVAIFSCRASVLTLEGANYIAGEAPVLVRLLGNRQARVRSHFERLQWQGD